MEKNDKGKIVSVVIPVYNAEAYLRRCLQAVFSSNYSCFEVIVVNDGSTDRTVELAREFPCRVLEIPQKRGPAYARNKAIEIAQGEYILFIDADVLVQLQTIEQIVRNFQQNPSAAALVGNITEDNGFSNFFSQFKNLHHRYHLLIYPDYINQTFTTITAVRKNVFNTAKGFNAAINTASVEDIEFGQRLSDLGFKILLDKTLEVVHLKYYSMKSYFLNTLNRSYCHFKLFLINHGSRRMVKEKRVVYFPLTIVCGFLLGPVILFLLVLSIYAFKNPAYLLSAIFTFLLFAVLNKGYLFYLLKKKGVYFSISSLFIILIDSWILSIGSSVALLDILRNRRNKWNLI